MLWNGIKNGLRLNVDLFVVVVGLFQTLVTAFSFCKVLEHT